MQLDSNSEIDVTPGRYVFVRDTEKHETAPVNGFRLGDITELDGISAARWSRRGAAVPYSGPAQKKRDVAKAKEVVAALTANDSDETDE